MVSVVDLVVSIIIDTYYRPKLLACAVQSLLEQTYKNIEIVIVDNGSTPETKDLIKEFQASDARVKVFRFDENQFSWDDPLILVRNCYNAGLGLSTGELIYYQSDDDWVAPDFIERMVALFQENPACVTAMGVAVGVHPDGREVSSVALNQRPRFMPGHEMALAAIDGLPVYSNPGLSFVMRRDALQAAGGFHECFEHHLLYGLAAFGVTGFDAEAKMYWRYHEGQLNKSLSDRGWISLAYIRSLLNEFGLERRWAEAFGVQPARRVALFLETAAYDGAAEVFATNLSSFRLAAAWRTLRIAGLDRRFLARLPARLWGKRRWFASSLLRVTGLRRVLEGMRG